MKYTFSEDLLQPFSNAFSGVINNLKTKLKLDKPIINVPEEKPSHRMIPNPISIASNMNNPEYNNEDRKGIELVDIRKSVGSGRKNKYYDSVQIDFDQGENNINHQMINKNKTYEFRTNEVSKFR